MVVIELVNVLGLDIGGANTKAAFLKAQDGAVKELVTLLEYFPIWKRKERLPEVLDGLKNRLVGLSVLDGVGVTITAELSDAYVTKKDGIYHVLDCMCHVFGEVPIFVLDVESNMLSVEEALKMPLCVASANWVATGWMVKQIVKTCIVLDVGSTTTSIIPVIDGKIVAEGKTDLEKLQNGELVYSGVLRTNIAAIVDGVPIRGRLTRVSSELFSQSGDVHLLLGNIKEDEYTAETCDGRGKTVLEAASRLVRVVCADTDMLTQQEIWDMANFVYGKQVEQIACGLSQVLERMRSKVRNVPVVVTGIGREFLGQKAAERCGFDDVLDMNVLLGDGVAVGSPSVGVALMAAECLEEKSIKWMRF